MVNNKVNLDFRSFFSSYSIDHFSVKQNLTGLVESIVESISKAFLALRSLNPYTFFSRRHLLQIKKDCHELKMNNFSKLEATAGKVDFYFHDCRGGGRNCQDLNTGSLNQKNIGPMIQRHFIDPFYSQNKPSKEKVEVPVPMDWKSENKWDKIGRALWKDLTTKQKIEVLDHYALAHNRVPKWVQVFPERILGFFLDLTFLWHGSSGVKQDPRTSHGSDHAARAAIWAGIFAYLYAKYHPDYTVSLQEKLIAQFAAGGHDCARQTESVDVFDEWSAEETMKPLRDKIKASVRFQKEAFTAIAHKDAPASASKPIIAKCVQNADCAEYSRLLLSSPMQSKDSFNNSRTHLDIWKEMNEYAKQNMQPGQTIEEVKLKNGFTFRDFAFELDAIRTEMNHFIFKTKGKREVFAQAPSYYDALISEIKPTKFPLLNAIINADQQTISAICRLASSNEGIAQALNLFRQIQSPLAKIDAFESIISSGSSHPNASRQFYDALPRGLQNEFKHQLWVANHRSDDGLGLRFGQTIVENGLFLNPLAIQAVRAMRSL